MGEKSGNSKKPLEDLCWWEQLSREILNRKTEGSRFMGKKIQKVVRTYPVGMTDPMGSLRLALDDGFRVVMCNRISDGYKPKKYALEYIVEKETEGEEDD